MSATYNTVTIGSTEFDVYADVATADQYLSADATSVGIAWRAQADETAKSRDLVTATRILDRQPWPGSKTDEDQPLAWPRTGTGLADVVDGIIPQAIIDACCLLAAYIEGGTDVAGVDTTDDRVRRQSAGSVSIEYFRDLDGGTRFPLPVQELLAGLLGGSTGLDGSISYGVDTCSRFEQSYRPGWNF